MNNSLIDILSLELLQNSTTNVEASLVSQSIAKPNVVCSAFLKQKTLRITKRFLYYFNTKWLKR